MTIGRTTPSRIEKEIAMTLRFVVVSVVAIMLVVSFLAPAPVRGADPIRIGFMGPMSGLFAQAGKDMLDGTRMYLEEVGHQAAGRKIEVIVEDDEGNNATALAKYRKLVQRDRIDVFTGVLLVNIGYALAPMVDRDQVPALFLTTPDDLTKRRRAKWIVRMAFSASQPMHALGDYAYKTLGYRKVVALAADNGYGHEQIAGFQRVFEEQGGRVVQKIWAPLNAQDFAPYITQIPPDVDAAVAVFFAGQAVRFLKQYAEYGLKGKLPLIGSGTTAEDSILRAVGDDAAGYIGVMTWAPNVATPGNQAFVKAATAKLGRTPSYFSAFMYSGTRWVVEAAKRVGGNVEDRERFFQAVRQVAQGEDIRGPIRLDEFGNPTQNVYVLKAEKVGGTMQNTVIHTYPAVSQFWTYNPEEFLKAPAYGRDYPPLKP
jgi:branched-chain amino acid transport system substrate-binding protein